MKKKNLIKCFFCGAFFVAIAIIVGILSDIENKSWWIYILLFILPFLATHIFNEVKENAPCMEWYKSWIKLKKESQHDRIRISFSYLFRIKIDDKYLLVKNSHGTNLFQPVGGVYKYYDSAKTKLQTLGSIEDSGEVIKMDSTTKNDFRLRVETRMLPKFVRWFQKEKQRETVSNLSREFSEELIESGILPKDIFANIQYTYIGQHTSDICPAKFNRNVYELFIADIVEVNFTQEQYCTIKNLQSHNTNKYCFVTEQMILNNKTKSGPDNNVIDIADHSFKILEVTESDLYKRRHQTYTVSVPTYSINN